MWQGQLQQGAGREGSRQHRAAKAPKMPVLVASSSLMGVLSRCKQCRQHTDRMLAFGHREGSRSSAPEPQAFQDEPRWLSYSLAWSVWAGVCVGCPGDVFTQGWKHVCQHPWEAGTLQSDSCKSVPPERVWSRIQTTPG